MIKRVLLTTYPQAFLLKGGGEFEMFSIAESLKLLGITADLYSPYSRSLSHYDAVIHFSIREEGLSLFREVKREGKPIFLWPNFWANNLKHPANKAAVCEMLDGACKVIFKSDAEKNHFNLFFDVPDELVLRVNTGADRAFLRAAPPSLFPQLFGLGDYAIWFGVIEPIKNQLEACIALGELGIPFVLVGETRNHEYLEACRAAHPKLTVIPFLPRSSEIARSALRQAMFYIEIPDDPPGISAIEAGLSGCKLILSGSEWSREHFGNFATYVDPHKPDEIKSGIVKALKLEPNGSAVRRALRANCLPASIQPLVDILKEPS